MSLESLILNDIESRAFKNKLWHDYILNLKDTNYTSYRLVNNHINSIKNNIRLIINEKINEILNGYTIIHSSIYDCDEDGPIYDVYCKNGWDGQQHYIKEAETVSLIYYYEEIVKNGIELNGRIYYIHEDIIFDHDKLELIDEETYYERAKTHNELLQVKNKFIEEYNKYINNSNVFWWKRKNYKFNLISCWSKEIFIKSLFILENFVRFSYNRKLDYNNMELFVNNKFLKHVSVKL